MRNPKVYLDNAFFYYEKYNFKAKNCKHKINALNSPNQFSHPSATYFISRRMKRQFMNNNSRARRGQTNIKINPMSVVIISSHFLSLSLSLSPNGI
jgi:hypothetical protein